MLHDMLRSRKFHILLAIAVFYVAWQVWLTIAAPNKIAGLAGESEKVNVLVTLAVSAGRFHFQRFRPMAGYPVRNRTPLKFAE
jgi:hypothetical protein